MLLNRTFYKENVELKREDKEEKAKAILSTETIMNSLKSNPMDTALYKFIENFDEKNSEKLSKVLGIKKRKSGKKLARDMEDTLISMERLTSILEKSNREDVENFAEAFEEEDEEKIKDPKIKAEGSIVIKNKDISTLFLKKEAEYYGKEITPKDIIKMHGWKNRKEIKRLIKRISASKFFHLILLLNRADPLEAEAILKKLLPALIQSGISEMSIKEIASILSKVLDKGKLKGSKEFFSKLKKITEFLGLFGGSENLVELLRESI